MPVMNINDFSERIGQVTDSLDKMVKDQVLLSTVIAVADLIAKAMQGGNKLLICGNGGSAADAQHMAGELVCRFCKDRAPLPALALSTDTSVLTAISAIRNLVMLTYFVTLRIALYTLATAWSSPAAAGRSNWQWQQILTFERRLSGNSAVWLLGQQRQWPFAVFWPGRSWMAGGSGSWWPTTTIMFASPRMRQAMPM